jgi:hypothetical protein
VGLYNFHNNKNQFKWKLKHRRDACTLTLYRSCPCVIAWNKSRRREVSTPFEKIATPLKILYPPFSRPYKHWCVDPFWVFLAEVSVQEVAGHSGINIPRAKKNNNNCKVLLNQVSLTVKLAKFQKAKDNCFRRFGKAGARGKIQESKVYRPSLL